jgi:hypothetical protein
LPDFIPIEKAKDLFAGTIAITSGDSSFKANSAIFRKENSEKIAEIQKELVKNDGLSCSKDTSYIEKTADLFFISHVVEDSEIALNIAKYLQEEGYETWNYETDAVVGCSYMPQAITEIKNSSALLVIISPYSLYSNIMTKEIFGAHDLQKNIIPILRGISDIEYKRRKPEWRKAIGAITSIVIPEQGVAEIFPTLLKTLESLNFKKTSSERRPSKNVPP